MNNIKDLAVFGGTFNPIHKAHIYIIEQFLIKYKVDKFLIIPTGIPPHKNYTAQVSNEDRLNMCNLAVKHIPQVQVSDIEIKRQGKSYTYETLQELKKVYKKANIYFLMGADMFKSFNSWKNPEEILALASICVIPRDNDEQKTLLYYKNEISSLYSTVDIDILNIDVCNISSTQVRKCIKEDKYIGDIVSNDVFNYIIENSLYQ